MKFQEPYSDMGLCELPQTNFMDGFDKTIVFRFSREIAQHMKNKLDTLEIPELVVLRRGVIGQQGKVYSRGNIQKPIVYSLLFFDQERWKFSCVKQETGEKVKGVLGHTHSYFLKYGSTYTAKKYFESWKQRKEDSGLIDLNNL